MPDTAKKTTALIILDGWGYREETEHNAIAAARTPTWDRLWQQAPKTLISGSGEDVGLPNGQMGNSEVGHISLGTGRIIYQSISRIDQAISDGEFEKNPAYCDALDNAINSGHAVHILGLLSPGGVHSHEQHIHAMIDMAVERGAEKVYVHAFLDGRDTPPRSAMPSLAAVEEKLIASGKGRLASIVGRYYAMDRDNRWDRVESAYRLLTEGLANYSAPSATNALELAYARDENDEFVAPTTVCAAGQAPVCIEDGDTVIFMNFRADRARELTRAFVEDDFDAFTRQQHPELGAFVMTTEYAADIDTPCAFPPEQPANGLGEYLSSLDKTQLRIAETEKYAHVTFFFSGGREETFPGEDRILVPSPQVATYDLKPEMSAPEVTDKLVAAIRSGKYDAIICNFANGDMVGHTGKFDAAVEAVEALDSCLERIINTLLECDGQALITADHGNVEQMVDLESGQEHTAHTCELVPLVYVGATARQFSDAPGRLCDVAPTLLQMMELSVPPEMTGRCLLV
jgi:2,3-bisphosphoglycerate-independent phosphoglycerate mutase